MLGCAAARLMETAGARKQQPWSTKKTVGVSVGVTAVVMLGLFAVVLLLLRSKGPAWARRRNNQAGMQDESGLAYELQTDA